MLCLRNQNCQSINFKLTTMDPIQLKNTNKKLYPNCQLNSANHLTHPMDFLPKKGYHYCFLTWHQRRYRCYYLAWQGRGYRNYYFTWQLTVYIPLLLPFIHDNEGDTVIVTLHDNEDKSLSSGKRCSYNYFAWQENYTALSLHEHEAIPLVFGITINDPIDSPFKKLATLSMYCYSPRSK